jgi:ATP-binding cassette, subfamily B, bacterial IrtB/YbtQ
MKKRKTGTFTQKEVYMSNSAEYATFKETYDAGIVITDTHAKDFRRSLLLYTLAFALQGLAYLCIYNLMTALFASPVRIHDAWLWFGVMGLCVFGNGFSRWHAHDFEYTDKMANITHNMRLKLGKKLRTMPLEVLTSYKTGDLNSSLSSNVDESVMTLGMIAGMFIETFLTPAVVIFGMFFIDWRMALVMLIILPLAIPLYRRKRSSGNRERKDLARANSELESDIVEYIQGLPVLRATNQTGRNARRLHEGVIKVRDLQRGAVWKTTLNLVMSDMLIVFALIMIAVLGSIWVGNGTMNVAVVAALLVIVSRLMEPMSLFLAVTQALDLMNAGFSRVKAILETLPLEVVSPESTAESFEIFFNGVDFAYHGQDEKALKRCSFSIPGQGMTAIVGPSGSGKTTITRLLMRYADPQSGSITIGGVDIRRMSQEELLSCFAVVFQDVYLFDESIIENIRMAKSDATDEEVIRAARAACCHEFIQRLPKGYETTVGDIGGSLSGGERQRISIARAILKDAPIVILDEPTAALDTESEVAVQKAIDTLVEDKTVIVIAHRLSTVAGADQILVIDEGRVVEQGNHSFLLENRGRYNALWQAQLRSKEWHIGEEA